MIPGTETTPDTVKSFQENGEDVTQHIPGSEFLIGNLLSNTNLENEPMDFVMDLVKGVNDPTSQPYIEGKQEESDDVLKDFYEKIIATREEVLDQIDDSFVHTFKHHGHGRRHEQHPDKAREPSAFGDFRDQITISARDAFYRSAAPNQDNFLPASFGPMDTIVYSPPKDIDLSGITPKDIFNANAAASPVQTIQSPAIPAVDSVVPKAAGGLSSVAPVPATAPSP